jgi:hypothetical protein
LFQLFATDVLDTGGKFTADVIDTGGNLTPGLFILVLFILVSLITVVVHLDLRISARIFEKFVMTLIFMGLGEDDS